MLDWTSLEDAMPDIGKPVMLADTDGGIYIGSLHDNGFIEDYCNEWFHSGIEMTDWAPLPSGPVARNLIHYGNWVYVSTGVIEVFKDCSLEGEEVTFDGCDVTCPECLKIMEENGHALDS